MSSPGEGSKNPQDKTNWDPYLKHASPLGILKPDIVFNVFGMAQNLPQPRLLRTTHREDGVSVFESDELVQPFLPFGPGASAFTLFDTRQVVPVNNTEPVPRWANTLPRCPPQGVLFSLSDIPPNYTVPMHRTLSLDYAVVISGEIVLELDGGEAKTIRAGEFLVQGGVNHKWVNRTEHFCRILFVLVASEKVTLADGTVLEETAFKSLAST